jgi:hypothetical protein
MSYVAVGVGGAALVYSMYSANQQAHAAQGVAGEQAQAAQADLEFQRQTRDMAVKISQMTPDEQASFASNLQLQSQFIKRLNDQYNREASQLGQVDSITKEAGDQALGALRGQETASSAILRRQRDLQRTNLENQLRRDMGEGFASSTAGAAILRKFDQDTSDSLQVNQENSIGRLINAQSQSIGNASGIMGQYGQAAGLAQSQTQSVLQANQNVIGRKIAAITSTPVNFQSVISTAGSQYTGDLVRSQQQQQILGGVTQGASLAAAYQLKK